MEARSTSSDEITILQIGPDGSGKCFRIRKDIFYSATPYFDHTNSLSIVLPKELTDDDPVVFGMFVDWLDKQEDPQPYIPLQYSKEPWRSHAATACLLGQKLCAAKFERYALSQFITNCATSNLSTWEHIDRQAQDKSALRRFSNHWAAWNCHLAPAGQSEYKDLSAAKLASAVNDDTNDPRIFDLDHWYSTCGDNINPTCSHDPIVRENAIEAFLALLQPKPEWGRDLETNKVLRDRHRV